MNIIKAFKASSARLSAILVLTGLMVSAGCTTTDKDIKAEITQLAKTDVNFADVKYTVEDKRVTLTGSCPSKKSKDEVEKIIKGIRVVKDVVSRLQIAPVTLTNAFPIKQGVDSILAGYPTVIADVSETEVTLSGKITKPEVVPLLTAIRKLNPPTINNKLQVK
ncbi:BON domain-containing protein [Mucilaginibacter terrenus]|nr:BON domain-containing protein [Mucilaginibacter terrenus]